MGSGRTWLSPTPRGSLDPTRGDRTTALMVHLGPYQSQPTAALVAGAPASDEERAFLQQRLIFLFKTLFLLDAGFYVITSLATPFVIEMPWVNVFIAPGFAFHLVSVIV